MVGGLCLGCRWPDSKPLRVPTVRSHDGRKCAGASKPVSSNRCISRLLKLCNDVHKTTDTLIVKPSMNVFEFAYCMQKWPVVIGDLSGEVRRKCAVLCWSPQLQLLLSILLTRNLGKILLKDTAIHVFWRRNPRGWTQTMVKVNSPAPKSPCHPPSSPAGFREWVVAS